MPDENSKSAIAAVIENPPATFSAFITVKSIACCSFKSCKRSSSAARPGLPKTSPINRSFIGVQSQNRLRWRTVELRHLDLPIYKTKQPATAGGSDRIHDLRLLMAEGKPPGRSEVVIEPE